MPQKPNASDWDRYFSKNPPRRRGPIALFVTMTLVLSFLAIVGLGIGFGTQQYGRYIEAQRLTSTPLWGIYYAQQTATAAAALGIQSEPTAVEPTTTVVTAGDLYTEPTISSATLVGQVAPGDVVAVLETRTTSEQSWYRVRLVSTTGPLAAGTTGWLSTSLVAPPPSPR